MAAADVAVCLMILAVSDNMTRCNGAHRYVKLSTTSNMSLVHTDWCLHDDDLPMISVLSKLIESQSFFCRLEQIIQCVG